MFSPFIATLFWILFLALSVGGLFGNGLVICAVLGHPKMRRSAMNLLLLNLVVPSTKSMINPAGNCGLVEFGSDQFGVGTRPLDRPPVVAPRLGVELPAGTLSGVRFPVRLGAHTVGSLC